jgi:hypothetical protein
VAAASDLLDEILQRRCTTLDRFGQTLRGFAEQIVGFPFRGDPGFLRGFGPFTKAGAQQGRGFVEEIESLVARLVMLSG